MRASHWDKYFKSSHRRMHNETQTVNRLNERNTITPTHKSPSIIHRKIMYN